MMEQFVKYLKLVACKVPKYVMIDKCATERAAVEHCGMNPILCEFHSQRIFNKRIKMLNLTVDQSVKLEKSINKLQRSMNDEQFNEKLGKLKTLTTALKQDNFFDWLSKNYLANEWKMAWVDYGRPNRVGINNTNNASETFFKSLLRGFLKGVSQYSPAEMLGIIDKDMIACYNYRLIQEEHHGRKFGGKNPSQKIEEKLT